MLDHVYCSRNIRTRSLSSNDGGVAAHDLVDTLLLLKFIHQEFVILFVHFPSHLRSLGSWNICDWIILCEKQFIVKQRILLQRKCLIQMVHWKLLTGSMDHSQRTWSNLTLWDFFFDTIFVNKRLIPLRLVISWEQMYFTHIIHRLLFIDWEKIFFCSACGYCLRRSIKQARTVIVSCIRWNANVIRDACPVL